MTQLNYPKKSFVNINLIYISVAFIINIFIYFSTSNSNYTIIPPSYRLSDLLKFFMPQTAFISLFWFLTFNFCFLLAALPISIFFICYSVFLWYVQYLRFRFIFCYLQRAVLWTSYLYVRPLIRTAMFIFF